MFSNPFNPYGPQRPKQPPAHVTPVDELDSPAERAKLDSQDAAPHETAAVLRMHRAGFTGAQTGKMLGMYPRELVDRIRIAIDEELEAHRQGRPIHDPKVPKGTK